MREGPLHSLIRLISGNQAAQYGLLTLIGPSGKTGCPSMDQRAPQARSR